MQVVLQVGRAGLVSGFRLSRLRLAFPFGSPPPVLFQVPTGRDFFPTRYRYFSFLDSSVRGWLVLCAIVYVPTYLFWAIRIEEATTCTKQS